MSKRAEMGISIYIYIYLPGDFEERRKNVEGEAGLGRWGGGGRAC